MGKLLGLCMHGLVLKMSHLHLSRIRMSRWCLLRLMLAFLPELKPLNSVGNIHDICWFAVLYLGSGRLCLLSGFIACAAAIAGLGLLATGSGHDSGMSLAARGRSWSVAGDQGAAVPFTACTADIEQFGHPIP